MPKQKPNPIPTRLELLAMLPPVKYEKSEKAERDRFDQVHLAGSLLLLAELSPEKEAALTRGAAQHLLGYVPEPDDADIGEQ